MTWDDVVRATKANCRGEVTTAVVDAVLRALIAEGLAIVPREATEEMATAAELAAMSPHTTDRDVLSAALSAGEIAPPREE